MPHNITCDLCHRTFTRNSNLYRHYRQMHVNYSRDSHHEHTDEHESHTYSDESSDHDFRNLVERKWTAIRTYFKCSRAIVDIFNFRLLEQTISLKQALRHIWTQKITNQVKLEVSVGFILQHKTSHEFRYFHSSHNNTLIFERPKTITSWEDLQRVAHIIKNADLQQKVLAARPNSSWVLHTLTNISFRFSKLPFPKFGKPCSIPRHLKHNCSVLTFTHDGKKKISDNLCAFRCIAIGIHCRCKHTCKCVRTKKQLVYDYYHRYAAARNLSLDHKNFEGLCLADLTSVEKIFSVKITVFSQNTRGVCNVIRHSFQTNYTHAINIVAVQNHFCLIKDLELFCKAFQCKTCKKCFKYRYKMSQHQRHCARQQTKFRFKGDCYQPKLGIFTEIEQQAGIDISNTDRIYPYRTTFDIECFLAKPENHSSTETMHFNHEHQLMSISICSNVPKFQEPICLVSDGNTQKLVQKFVDYLHAISKEAYDLLTWKFRNVLTQLENYDQECKRIEAMFKGYNLSSPRVYESRSQKSLLERFHDYLRELPVISFNGQRYDLNVLKTPLVKHLLTHDPISFAIKRNNSLKCIKTQFFKFLDITNYIAPGFSYDNFIKAYNCQQTKGYFCYEYIDSLERLKETSLPAHSAFYSSLKKTNITLEQYEHCRRIWRENNMQTLEDYLVYYNNLDVVPFLEAIEKQAQIYKVRNIDMFKDGVSVPALATKWLYNESNLDTFSVPLINKQHIDLYHTVRSNIVGGPSIVFHRYHEKNKTLIRENEFGPNAKKCKKIYGLDANALYLWSAMQNLPTGSMIRRRSTKSFKPEFVDKHGRQSLEWLEFISFHESIQIQHKYNKGEFKVGQHALPVDGYDSVNKTVFQFHGCLFHGCPIPDCPITKDLVVNPVNNKRLAVLQQDTIVKSCYIQAYGYKLRAIYECQWQEYKANNPSCRQWIEEKFKRDMISNTPMTEHDIISALHSKQFYGLVECDILVPSSLHDKFAEMPPIFKHASISRSDLSGVMLDFARQHDLLKLPQKTLIGSFTGTKVLLLTDLLSWYLDHGLQVTKIYQIVQFKPFKCFEKFGESICDSRREGDKDPSKKIIGETAKLSGNSIYGTTITNKELFTDVKYVSTPEAASKFVNKSSFIALNELAEDAYEISLAKPSIELDTPIVIGFAILQLAKMRMLQLYYDLMCVYFNKCDFQYCTMDTDSAYMALSDELENCIKPHLKRSFYENFETWFPPTFCSRHKKEFVEAKVHGNEWHMRSCCKKTFDYHRRTPGLFKEEFSGNGIICLNSKTYFCFGDKGNKMSTKGIMKRQNAYQRKHFLSVLRKKCRVKGSNSGITLKANKVYTYTQSKSALNFFYAKRIVANDGVTTFPLLL